VERVGRIKSLNKRIDLRMREIPKHTTHLRNRSSEKLKSTCCSLSSHWPLSTY